MASDSTVAKDYMTPEELFDSIGPAYEIAFQNLRTQLESVEWIMSEIHHRKPAKILDLGCGTGKPVCAAFADAGHDVLGIDISETMLRQARERLSNVAFIKADVFEVQLRPQSFDAITVYFSLSTGTSQDKIRQQIKRLYEWLRPEGVLVIATVPFARNEVRSYFMGRPFIGSGLSQEEYLQRLKEVGFDIKYHNVSIFRPEAVEAGLCTLEENHEEPHLFIYAKK